MTAQKRADDLEKYLRSLSPHDPRRGALQAELRLWRTKALRSDARDEKRKRRAA